MEGLSAQDWRCHIVSTAAFPAEEQGFAPLHIHEEAALDPDTIGWKQSGFNDSGWAAAKAIPPKELPESRFPEELCPRPIPQMALIPHSFALRNVPVPANSEKELVLDAGEEMCAYLRLCLSGGRGAKIELLQSECYTTENGKQNRLDSEHGYLEGEYYPRSECHAWGALALYALPSEILGVRPAAPGYKQIEVRPQPGVLTSASGTVHTPRGDVSVAWEKNGADLKLEISCDAEVRKRIVS